MRGITAVRGGVPGSGWGLCPAVSGRREEAPPGLQAWLWPQHKLELGQENFANNRKQFILAILNE